VLMGKASYNYVFGDSTYTVCYKHHAIISGGKAVDSEGNRYNVIHLSGGQDEGIDYSGPSYDTSTTVHAKLLFVGQGQLSNSILSFTYNCHYSYNPTDGYIEDCPKDNWSFKCSA